MSYFSLQ